MKSYYVYLLSSILLLGLISCNRIEEPIGDGEIVMVLNGQVNGYDNTLTKASNSKDSTSTWKDGDILYLSFYNGTNVVPGNARYTKSKGWSMSNVELSKLKKGEEQKCEVRYFEKAQYASQYLVTIADTTCVYETLNAVYYYNNDTLSVSAQLKPKTGRIRFTGNKGTQIKLMGISKYSSYSPQNNKFEYNSSMISTKVDTTTTPYIYGFFADTTKRNIGIITSTSAYSRECDANVLKTGESGYMAVPTESNSFNWSLGLSFKAEGVEFKMMPVAGHNTGFFLIGQTEVTEELYKKVMKTDPTSKSQLPVDDITYSSILSFIEKLNGVTDATFKLPTLAQWQYAAKGGKVSQKFTYSGSNTASDVAWYSVNASSKQAVKGKAPNELGIFDMSGNVGEYLTYNDSDSYYYYSSYYYPYICGGSYLHPSSEITSTSKDNAYSCYLYLSKYKDFYNQSSSSVHYKGAYSDCKGVGFRLVLEIK